MKKIIFISLLSSLVFSQADKKVIAVTEIDHKGLSNIALQRIYNRLETELFNLGKYSVTTRGEIDKILKEQEFQYSGCTQQECAAEIGRFLNANYMLLPNILYEPKSGNLSATFKLVNVETAQISSVVTRDLKVNNAVELSSKIFPMLVDLYKKETGEDPSIQITRQTEETKFEIVFRLNVEEVYCRYNQYAPLTSSGDRAIFKLSAGEYTFYFEKNQYKRLEKTIYVEKDQEINIELKSDKRQIVEYLAPGIVMIETKPEGCEILVSGQKIGTTPYTGVLNPGTHSVELRKELYYTAILSFVLEPGETETVEHTLDPKFGVVSIIPLPTGSRVKIDGKVYPTPQDIRINSGRHIATIDRNMYHTYEESFEIFDGDNKTINAVLKPAFGSLEIDTYPETTADVYIDDKLVGTTPYTYNPCPSGEYVIKVKKPFFNTASERVNVTDEATAKRTLLLTPNVGTLIVNAPSSDIYINNKNLGRERFEKKYPAGIYVVRAERKDHYPDEKELFVIVGQIQTINLEPMPKKGSISVIVSPPGTKNVLVLLDGIEQGTAPKVITVPVGNHTIETRGENYLDAKKEIIVEENKNIPVQFDLMTYAGSVKQELDKWTKRNRISGISFILSSTVAGYLFNQADAAFANYQGAATTQSALDYRETVKDNESYTMVALGLSGISALNYLWTRGKKNKAKWKLHFPKSKYFKGRRL
jgi:hypothetical protein